MILPRVVAALMLSVVGACTSIAADARTFENTTWRVTAINDRATPPGGDYRVEFRGGRIGGRFGCNHFGGPYTVQRDTLIAREVASTLMGCPEPAASFETQGFAVLHQPMRMNWSSGRALTLSNAAGSIALERAP